MITPDPIDFTSILEALKVASGPVLDLGCGTGLHTRALSAALRSSTMRAEYPVVGLDLDVDALETARTLADPEDTAVWGVGNAEALPFEDGRFAAVLCVDVLHWSRDAAAFAAAWAEARRVLRPGGVLQARLLILSGAGATHEGGGWYRADQSALEGDGAVVMVEDARTATASGRAWVIWRKP